LLRGVENVVKDLVDKNAVGDRHGEASIVETRLGVVHLSRIRDQRPSH
jgi:hypothetical protein